MGDTSNKLELIQKHKEEFKKHIDAIQNNVNLFYKLYGMSDEEFGKEMIRESKGKIHNEVMLSDIFRDITQHASQAMDQLP